MAGLELCFFILSVFQGLFFLILLLLSAISRVLSSFLLQRSWTSRKKFKTIRMFECAAYSRLNSQVRYGVQSLGLLSAFIIYDVDIIFFVPEVTNFNSWSASTTFYFVIYLCFFSLALLFDNKKGGFLWIS